MNRRFELKTSPSQVQGAITHWATWAYLTYADTGLNSASEPDKINVDSINGDAS